MNNQYLAALAQAQLNQVQQAQFQQDIQNASPCQYQLAALCLAAQQQNAFGISVTRPELLANAFQSSREARPEDGPDFRAAMAEVEAFLAEGRVAP